MNYLVLTIIFIVIVLSISHMPIYKLNSKQKESIKKNGLLHFTSVDSFEQIKVCGLIGKKSDMGYPESLLGNIVWMYINESDNTVFKKHRILLTKDRVRQNSQSYNLCIKLSGISDKDIDNMRVRYGVFKDRAIIYQGTLFLPDKIEKMKMF